MLKLVGVFWNLSVYKLQTSGFNLVKSTVFANVDVSMPVAFLKSPYVASLNKPNSSFTLPPEDFGSGKYSLIYTMSFFNLSRY